MIWLEVLRKTTESFVPVLSLDVGSSGTETIQVAAGAVLLYIFQAQLDPVLMSLDKSVLR